MVGTSNQSYPGSWPSISDPPGIASPGDHGAVASTTAEGLLPGRVEKWWWDGALACDHVYLGYSIYLYKNHISIYLSNLI